MPGKSYVEYLPTGPASVEHVTIRKEGDFSWEPSWNMRSKVADIALEAFTSVLSDEATAHEVECEKASRELAQAQSKVEQAEKDLAEAKAEREALANALNKILSAGPTQYADVKV